MKLRNARSRINTGDPNTNLDFPQRVPPPPQPGPRSLLGEEEHLQANLDRDHSKEHLEPSHDFDCPIEALDFALVFLDEVSREDVGPELG
jgi:hypothetical protein